MRAAPYVAAFFFAFGLAGFGATGARPLIPPLPPAPFVGLPTGDLKSARLAIRPGAAGKGKCVRIVAVEQHHALVALAQLMLAVAAGSTCSPVPA